MIKLLDLVSKNEILCFDVSVLNSQSSCWTLLAFLIFKEKRNRNDQVAGLGSKMRFCVSTSVCSISRSSCWTWLAFFIFLKKKEQK